MHHPLIIMLYLQGRKPKHGFRHLQCDERTWGYGEKNCNNSQKLPENIKGLCYVKALHTKEEKTYPYEEKTLYELSSTTNFSQVSVFHVLALFIFLIHKLNCIFKHHRASFSTSLSSSYSIAVKGVQTIYKFRLKGIWAIGDT